VERIDELLRRIKKQQEAELLKKIRRDTEEWFRTHRLAFIEVIVRNRVTPGVEFYTAYSVEEVEEIIKRIAERRTPFTMPIREVLPGLYEVGPYEVIVHRKWVSVGEEG